MEIVTSAKQIAAHTPHKTQPLSVLESPDALLTVKTAAALMGAGVSTVYGLARTDPKFPKLIKHGARCTRIRAGDLTNWLRAHAKG